MPEKDYEPILREIAATTATTSANLANLTELFHDWRASNQSDLMAINRTLDNHGNRIVSLEQTRSNDATVRRVAKWLAGTAVAIVAAIGGSHALSGKP